MAETCGSSRGQLAVIMFKVVFALTINIDLFNKHNEMKILKYNEIEF